MSLLEKHFPPTISSSFFIIAYNPRVHPEDDLVQNKIKRHHMRKLQEHYLGKPQEIIFFDDSLDVVADCKDTCEVMAFCVDPNFGFRVEDLLHNL